MMKLPSYSVTGVACAVCGVCAALVASSSPWLAMVLGVASIGASALCVIALRKLDGADKSCMCMVKDGKIWCNTHKCFHQASWECEKHPYPDHHFTQVGMRHVLYVAFVCNTCNDGIIYIDEEQ